MRSLLPLNEYVDDRNRCVTWEHGIISIAPPHSQVCQFNENSKLLRTVYELSHIALVLRAAKFPYFPSPKYPVPRRTHRFRRKTLGRRQMHIRSSSLFGMAPFCRHGVAPFPTLTAANCQCGFQIDSLISAVEKKWKIILRRYPLNKRLQCQPKWYSRHCIRISPMSFRSMLFTNGTAITDRSLAMRFNTGSSQPSKQSTWASKNIITSPWSHQIVSDFDSPFTIHHFRHTVAFLAPIILARMSPSRFSVRIWTTLAGSNSK